MLIFKEQRQKDEWQKVDGRVKALVYVLVMEASHRNKDYRGKITEVFRTDAEHKAIYKDRSDMPGNTHGDWRAADVIIELGSGLNMPHTEAMSLCEYINSKFILNDLDEKNVCKYHSVQTGDTGHFHIQVSYTNQTRLR